MNCPKCGMWIDPEFDPERNPEKPWLAFCWHCGKFEMRKANAEEFNARHHAEECSDDSVQADVRQEVGRG